MRAPGDELARPLDAVWQQVDAVQVLGLGAVAHEVAQDGAVAAADVEDAAAGQRQQAGVAQAAARSARSRDW